MNNNTIKSILTLTLILSLPLHLSANVSLEKTKEISKNETSDYFIDYLDWYPDSTSITILLPKSRAIPYEVVLNHINKIAPSFKDHITSKIKSFIATSQFKEKRHIAIYYFKLPTKEYLIISQYQGHGWLVQKTKRTHNTITQYSTNFFNNIMGPVFSAERCFKQYHKKILTGQWKPEIMKILSKSFNEQLEKAFNNLSKQIKA